jgi:hypothetical protein
MSGECEERSKEQRLGLQTQLKVNESGDIYEQEADWVADQVMATPADAGVSGASLRIQRFSGQLHGPMDTAPASVDRALASPGRPLELALRQDIEQRFGSDFSRVRVHTSTAAEQSARDVNAHAYHAYMVGHNIVFGAGRFALGTLKGGRLLAHELSHVVQQSGADGMYVGQRDEQWGLSIMSGMPLSGQPPGHERATNRLAWAERGVREPGLALPAGLRTFVEAQFGRRFDAVRLHTGPRAADAARQLGAAAYTLGGDIAFGQGSYEPSTSHGLRLLAHELTHVVQSQGAPVGPLRAGEAAAVVGPLEREAERASDALGWGPVEVRERLGGRLPLCHPIYISGHGKQEQPIKFFTAWGYSPIKTGVMSIEDVVRDLAGHSSIEHISIVSHANSQFLMMQFINGGPAQVNKSDWEVQSVTKLLNLERHVVQGSTVDDVIRAVQKVKPGAFARIGGATHPFVRQFIWWVVESVQADRARWAAALSIQMKQTAQAHIAIYRDLLLGLPTQATDAGSSGQPAVSVADFTEAELDVTTEANRLQWEKIPPPPVSEQQAHERRIRESPSSDIARIALKPDFFDNLSKVQLKVNDSSWIEILGCHAGKDRDYLTAIQRFFGGGTAKKPKVTGPDWFQFWGHYGWTGIDDTEKGALVQWESKKVDVRAALNYWYPIITGNTLPRTPTHWTLLAYLRQGHALPLAVPNAPSIGHVLFLNRLGLRAFLDWLSRHSYPLTKVRKAALFKPTATLGENISEVPVEWLQEQFSEPTRIIFRPSPEYDKHIVKVT